VGIGLLLRPSTELTHDSRECSGIGLPLWLLPHVLCARPVHNATRLTTEMTDRRRDPARSANCISEFPGCIERRKLAAVRVHRFVRLHLARKVPQFNASL
jgi:hypothetical protein